MRLRRSRRNSRPCGAKSTTRSRPPGASSARRLAHRPGRVVEVVQHLMDDDEVEAAAREGRRIDVALAQLDAGEARLLEIGARDRRASRGWHRARRRARHAAREAAASGRCRCRDRGDVRTGFGPTASSTAASTAVSGACSERMRSHSRREAREEGLARPERPLVAHGSRAARGRRRARIGPVERRQERTQRYAAGPARSPSRKKAQAPSRWRSTRPASARSLRWREMRGCDWPRMSVRSETDSSPSASSARMRSRVSSAAARRPSRVSGNPAAEVVIRRSVRMRHKHIFI